MGRRSKRSKHAQARQRENGGLFRRISDQPDPNDLPEWAASGNAGAVACAGHDSPVLAAAAIHDISSDSEEDVENIDIQKEEEDFVNAINSKSFDSIIFEKWLNSSHETGVKRKSRMGSVYSGDSRTTKWRKSKEEEKILDMIERGEMKTLHSFFDIQSEDDDVNVGKYKPRLSRNSLSKLRIDALQKALTSVEEILTKRDRKFTRLELIQFNSIAKFLEIRLKGVGRVISSKQVSDEMPKMVRRGQRAILSWVDCFAETGDLPKSKQGRHQKTKSLLSDKDVESDCINWLREAKKNERNPLNFRKFLMESVFPKYISEDESKKRTISVRSCSNWMIKLGYKYGMWKKGVYIDGHEREDVVEYRKRFCLEMMEYLKRMKFYSGDNMEKCCERHDLENQEIVWVCHDESCYWANDDGGKGWSSEEYRDLHKKGRGKALMVSDFICPCHGRLYHLDEHGEKVYSMELLRVGKNDEGYWTAEHVKKQIEEKAIQDFEFLHPNCVGLFCFDNSTNHGAMAPDGLVANRMNLKSGGKQPIMHGTWYSNADGVRTEQSLVSEDGKPKGIRNILNERGLWIKGLKLDCKKEVELNSNLDYKCCARHRLGSQPDFLGEVSMIETAIKKRNHLALFLPKFHCELNPIEMLWGASKRICRAECDYTFNGLCVTVAESLERIPLAQIRRYFRRCLHLIEAYHLGMPHKLAVFAHKKYRSHRRFPEINFKLLEIELLGKK